MTSWDGFVSGRYCSTLFPEVQEIFTTLVDRIQCAATIYLGFVLVFNIVPHKRLMVNLENCGVTRLYDFIKYFLSERCQLGVMNGTKSE